MTNTNQLTKATEYQLKAKRDTHSRGIQIKSAVTSGRPEMAAVKILAKEGLVTIHWEESGKVCYSNKF